MNRQMPALTWKIAWIVGLALAIAVIDRWLQSDIAGGVLYIAVVLFAMRLPKSSHITMTATACTVLVIAGSFWPSTDIVGWTALTNRSLAVFTTWTTAIFARQWKKQEMVLLQNDHQLQDSIRECAFKLESTVDAHSQALEEMRAAKFRLFMLSDAATQMTQLLDIAGIEDLERMVVDHAVSLLDAGMGYLLLINPATQHLETRNHFAVPSRETSGMGDLSIPLDADVPLHPLFSMLRDVAITGRAQRRSHEQADNEYEIQTLAAAPIFGRDILGVLVVCNREGRGHTILAFNDEDLLLLESFGNQAGIAIENARLYQEALEKRRLKAEMEEAAKIQQRLLPTPAEIPGYDLAGLNIAHRDGIGGDYYDHIPLPDGTWGLAIADVAGKGMQAALLVATLRASLRNEVEKQDDLPTMAQTINTFVYESSPNHAYATLFYAKLCPKTDMLTSINAGHNPPLLLRHDGSIEMLDTGGLVIGMFPNDVLCQMQAYEHGTTQLKSGDVVVFYTDGISETMNLDDQMYGTDRLAQFVKGVQPNSSADICRAIYYAVTEFRGEAEPFDDLTLMVLKKE